MKQALPLLRSRSCSLPGPGRWSIQPRQPGCARAVSAQAQGVGSVCLPLLTPRSCSPRVSARSLPCEPCGLTATATLCSNPTGLPVVTSMRSSQNGSRPIPGRNSCCRRLLFSATAVFSFFFSFCFRCELWCRPCSETPTPTAIPSRGRQHNRTVSPGSARARREQSKFLVWCDGRCERGGHTALHSDRCG